MEKMFQGTNQILLDMFGISMDMTKISMDIVTISMGMRISMMSMMRIFYEKWI